MQTFVNFTRDIAPLNATGRIIGSLGGWLELEAEIWLKTYSKQKNELNSWSWESWHLSRPIFSDLMTINTFSVPVKYRQAASFNPKFLQTHQAFILFSFRDS